MARSIAVRGALVLVLGGLSAACGTAGTAEIPEVEPPAVVEAIDGREDLHRITLTEQAAERLGIETVAVTPDLGATGRTRIPYSSIIYDAEGIAWAYVEDEARSFVRHALTVRDIVTHPDGDYAVLSEGPAAGTTVVSVGVAELFGAEFDVGH